MVCGHFAEASVRFAACPRRRILKSQNGLFIVLLVLLCSYRRLVCSSTAVMTVLCRGKGAVLAPPLGVSAAGLFVFSTTRPQHGGR